MTTVLGFDTSGGWCGTALFKDQDVVAARYEPMVRGQAERLFPMLEETLEEGEASYSDLDAIGVGTGPGNFTGIRISVSAARGLALSLNKPAIGVSLFEALAEGAPRPALLVIAAPQGRFYASVLTEDSGQTPPALFDAEALPKPPSGAVVVGETSRELASRFGLPAVPARFAPASAIARIAARHDLHSVMPPTPLYIRPADAAPPRDPAPVIRE